MTPAMMGGVGGGVWLSSSRRGPRWSAIIEFLNCFSATITSIRELEIRRVLWAFAKALLAVFTFPGQAASHAATVASVTVGIINKISQ